MAPQLTPEAERYFQDLTVHVDERIAEYKKCWEQKSEEEIRLALKEVREYLTACRNSEVDDTLTNLRFLEAKALVLEKLVDSVK